MATHFDRVLNKIVEFGFLLESDPKLPSVCSLIAGEPMRGSWWSHPLAQTIFQVNERLEDHPDITITKLVSGKVTFVHRKLWPELISIGGERGNWQIRNLSVAAKRLLKEIEKQGVLRTDQVVTTKSEPKQKLGNVARELELSLLIHADQIHTESGAHAKILETWQHWSKRTKFKAALIDPGKAKQRVEDLLIKLNTEFDGKGSVPWVGK